MGFIRSRVRSLRQQTAPIRNQLRLLRGIEVVQATAELRPEDRTGKRRRQHVLVDLINRYCTAEKVAVVEVGTVGGATSVHISRYCPQVDRIYAVDIVKPDPSIDLTRDVECIELVVAPSVEAAKRFADKSVDLVFIDADHSADAVYRDLEAWEPKIKPGGVIAGHDYGSHNYPGVKPAVDFFFARRSLPPVQTDVDRVWWTIK